MSCVALAKSERYLPEFVIALEQPLADNFIATTVNGTDFYKSRGLTLEI
jgi:hypothetical protein